MPGSDGPGSDGERSPLPEAVDEVVAALDDPTRTAVLDAAHEVHAELARLFRDHAEQKRRGPHPLRLAAIVREACVRVARQRGIEWNVLSALLAAGAILAGELLSDVGRAGATGAGARTPDEDPARGIASIELGADFTGAPVSRDATVVLDALIERVLREDPTAGRVARLRIWGGLSNGEAAEAIGVSVETARRAWTTVAPTLRKALEDSGASKGD